MRAMDCCNGAREGGVFKYSTACGSMPALLIVASALRDVPQSGLWSMITSIRKSPGLDLRAFSPPRAGNRPFAGLNHESRRDFQKDRGRVAGNVDARDRPGHDGRS